MDTIIYFYQQKQTETILRDRIQLAHCGKPYELRRIGLPACFWHCRVGALPVAPQKGGETENGQAVRGTENGQTQAVAGLRGLLRRRKAGRKKRITPDGEQTQSVPEQSDIQQRQRQLQTLAEELRAAADETTSMYMVADEAVRQLAADIPEWPQSFPYGDFAAYREADWAGQLMSFSGEGDFLIVGYAPCIPTLLTDNARRIRSVRWTLSEAVCTGTLKEFAEEFYDEYGIVITLQTIAPMESLRKAYPASDHPVTVLDFSGETYLSAMGVCAGSVWLDMDADEQKERRLAAGHLSVNYFSLKRIWRNFERFS